MAENPPGRRRNGDSKQALKYIALIAALVTLLMSSAPARAYVLTNRDTRPQPERVAYAEPDTAGYTFLEKTGHMEFYYREDRDVFLIIDTRNGYSWKTGLDTPFNQDTDRAVSDADTPEEKALAAVPKEDRLNATYIAFANSLLTVELYDDAFNLNLTSSASHEGAESALERVGDGQYRLSVNFTAIDLQITAYITLNDSGITGEVPDGAITGPGAANMASIILMPFLGASGGVVQLYDPVLGRYDQKIAKPMIPGYIFVPDGSGGLIRFKENSVEINKYVGSVYGVNPAEAMFYYDEEAYDVAAKEPLMPVFGVAHGDRQAAFAAWATDGAEH
ncbi:MAG: DUF5696 domain-containing protein, partial [Clostridiales bacterium]|nr:DUF5696 domain-containing protein [Clostridiales bacterium]